MKENDYYNIHRKFQVHFTNIRSKNKYRQVATTPKFESLSCPYAKVGW